MIINTSSGGASRAHRGMVAYDAAKGGVEAFTRAVALDLAPYGVRCVCIVPGLMETSDAGPQPRSGRARPPRPCRSAARAPAPTSPERPSSSPARTRATSPDRASTSTAACSASSARRRSRPSRSTAFRASAAWPEPVSSKVFTPSIEGCRTAAVLPFLCSTRGSARRRRASVNESGEAPVAARFVDQAVSAHAARARSDDGRIRRRAGCDLDRHLRALGFLGGSISGALGKVTRDI